MGHFKALVYVLPGVGVGLAETVGPWVDHMAGLAPALILVSILGSVGGVGWYVAYPRALAGRLKFASFYWLLLVALVAVASTLNGITPEVMHIPWSIGQGFGLLALACVLGGLVVAERGLTHQHKTSNDV